MRWLESYHWKYLWSWNRYVEFASRSNQPRSLCYISLRERHEFILFCWWLKYQGRLDSLTCVGHRVKGEKSTEFKISLKGNGLLSRSYIQHTHCRIVDARVVKWIVAWNEKFENPVLVGFVTVVCVNALDEVIYPSPTSGCVLNRRNSIWKYHFLKKI